MKNEMPDHPQTKVLRKNFQSDEGFCRALGMLQKSGRNDIVAAIVGGAPFPNEFYAGVPEWFVESPAAARHFIAALLAECERLEPEIPGDLLEYPTLMEFQSWREAISRLLDVSSSNWRLWHSFAQLKYPWPPPPFAGTAEFRPLRSRKEVIDAAAECASYCDMFIEDVYTGDSYFYEYHGEPLATVELKKTDNHWRLEDVICDPFEAADPIRLLAKQWLQNEGAPVVHDASDSHDRYFRALKSHAATLPDPRKSDCFYPPLDKSGCLRLSQTILSDEEVQTIIDGLDEESADVLRFLGRTDNTTLMRVVFGTVHFWNGWGNLMELGWFFREPPAVRYLIAALHSDISSRKSKKKGAGEFPVLSQFHDAGEAVSFLEGLYSARARFRTWAPGFNPLFLIK